VRVIGTYLRTLIEQQGLTVHGVAVAVGVHDNYIWRLEKGKIKRPSFELLTKLAETVNGRTEDVFALFSDPGATSDDARDLALSLFDPDLRAVYDGLRSTPAGRARLRAAAQKYL
jgi:transcriptional regulator with XRE-family HTH domain